VSESAAIGQSPPAGGAGAALLAERRRQGLSLGDVSRQLKLAVRQVEALERDDYAGFTSPVFVHGFIRNYAKLLNLDPEPLIRTADNILNPPAPAKEPDDAAESALIARRRGIRIVPAVSTVVAVAIVIAVVVQVLNRSGPRPVPDEPVVAAVEPPSQPIVLETAAKPTAKPATGNAVVTEPGERATLRMVFDQESWVEIRDRNGNTIFGQLNPAGSRRSVSGEPPFDVVVGNAAGVRLTYKDENVDLSAHTRVDVARVTLK